MFTIYQVIQVVEWKVQLLFFNGFMFVWVIVFIL